MADPDLELRGGGGGGGEGTLSINYQNGGILSSNGVLESLLRAVKFRQLDEQNRARNGKEHFSDFLHTNVVTYIKQNDGEGEYGSYACANLQ